MESFSDKIQDYIEGTLTQEEILAFENQLHIDSDLRTMVKLQREVHDILNSRINSTEVELRNTLAEVELKTRYGAVRNVINFKKIISIAAVFLVISFGTLWFYKTNENSIYELPIMQSEIVRGELSNSSYEDAVLLFNTSKYNEAQLILKELISKDSTVIQYQYYYGLCFIGDHKWDAAISSLHEVANGESIFADDAKYYLALAYYKLDKLNEAHQYLNKISDESNLADKILKLKKKID